MNGAADNATAVFARFHSDRAETTCSSLPRTGCQLSEAGHTKQYHDSACHTTV